jgi:hypothetical protein
MKIGEKEDFRSSTILCVALPRSMVKITFSTFNGEDNFDWHGGGLNGWRAQGKEAVGGGRA